MKSHELQPIDMGANFGARKRSRDSLAHPVPTAKALNTRRKDERLQVATTPIRTGTTRGLYTGGELMNSTRAGAMDALRLPSLQMGQLVHRKDGQQ